MSQTAKRTGLEEGTHSKDGSARSSPGDITLLLASWGNGDQRAFEDLIPLVYQELHRLAGRYMRGERSGHTLQTTALVNEVYLRLQKAQGIQCRNRAHFFAVAARAMRRILVDFARARQQQKRDGGRRLELDEALGVCEHRGAGVIALDEALSVLARLDKRQSQIVELRFFGGLTEIEIAEVLNVSPRTVSGEWRLARSWLLRELSQDGVGDP